MSKGQNGQMAALGGKRLMEPPILVHSDLRYYLQGAAKKSRHDMLIDALECVAQLAQGRRLWFPTYNYDFAVNGRYSVQESPSQVGVLTEFFRRNHASWRTETPMFSIAGEGPAPTLSAQQSDVNPFSTGGIFSALIQQGGSVLLFGVGIRMASVFHHAEVSNGRFPVYRFQKEFSGTTVRMDGSEVPTKIAYQVSPLEKRVLYDWGRITRWALEYGFLVPISGRSCYHLDPRAFVHAWLREVAADPFWPLDTPTRSWVEPMVDRLGRGFVQNDFEP